MNYFRILPESIRWLISKTHYHEVRKLVLRAADVNGTLFPERLFHSCEDQGSPQVMVNDYILIAYNENILYNIFASSKLEPFQL